MLKRMLAAVCVAVSIFGPMAWAADEAPAEVTHLTAAEQAQIDKIKGILNTLDFQHGVVALKSAKVRVDLGESYAFLGPADAKKLLVDVWGNPPDAASDVLGMIFPRGGDLMDKHSWSAVLTYEPTGYVSDKNAKSEDYEKVLTEMQQDALASNPQRLEQGYPTVEVVGWAQPPSYDQASHNLIWARNLRFGDAPDVNTLNYDVRHLGRFGVLSMNVIASMEDLPAIKPAAAQLARTVEFDQGARYADHQAMDKKAAYGLAGLVAAGAGLAVVKKAGLLALILVFAKKGLVLLMAVGAAIAARFRNLFGAKARKKLVVEEQSAPEPNRADGPWS